MQKPALLRISNKTSDQLQLYNHTIFAKESS